MPESRMLLHSLPHEVKCPACGGGLTFVRVRQYGDLYYCATGASCRCVVFHFRHKETRACGWAIVTNYGTFGTWTACE